MAKKKDAQSRRAFLAKLMVGAAALPIINKVFTQEAKASSKVFGSQFLEKGHSIDVPPGHYDPEKKLYINEDTGRPAFVDKKPDDPTILAGTSEYTTQYTNKCTSQWYPKDGPPQCQQWDQDTDTSKLDWD